MGKDIQLDVIGRWPGILSALGIQARWDNKHGPCPLGCGGKKSFRFDDKDGKGTWICTHCGASNGWELVIRYFQISFIEAVKKVGEIMGDIPKNVQKKVEKDYRKMLNDTWRLGQNLVSGDPVMEYLAGRGLKLIPDQVKYLPACWESEMKTRMPAMLALVTGPDGKPVTIHRTYLQDGNKAQIESPKKLMPHNGTLKGAAIRLFPVAEHMGICEGAETAISCKQLFDINTWSAITSGIMESWLPPSGVERVTIYSDNDTNFCGQKSSYILANKLALKGMLMEVKIPPKAGQDWNDVLLDKILGQKTKDAQNARR